MDPNTNNPLMDKRVLYELVNTKMPFGKYAGRLLCDLPERYLVWFKQKGFPPGQIGIQLAAMYEIKVNGLEFLLKPIREDRKG